MFYLEKFDQILYAVFMSEFRSAQSVLVDIQLVKNRLVMYFLWTGAESRFCNASETRCDPSGGITII